MQVNKHTTQSTISTCAETPTLPCFYEPQNLHNLSNHWGKEAVLGQGMTPDTIHWWTVKILQLIDAFWLSWGPWPVAVICRMGSTALSPGRISPGTAAPQGPWKQTVCLRHKGVPTQNPEESHSGIPTLKNHSPMGLILMSNVTICAVF